MHRIYFTLLLVSSVSATFLSAESTVDCRVITGKTDECNLYSSRLIKAKEVTYDTDKQKLIVTKTLPVPGKKPKMKVVSVADMIEKYVKVEPSMRYRGSEDIPGTVTESKQVYMQGAALRRQREKIIAQTGMEKKKQALKRLEALNLAKAAEEKKRNQGFYTISKGDTLSTIAAKYGLKTKELRALNQLDKAAKIKVGSKLLLPFPQEMINAVATGEYKVQSDDTLISIARKFNLEPRLVAKFNDIKSTAIIRVGKIVQLPFAYRIRAMEAKKKAEAAKKKRAKSLARHKKARLIRRFGKHKLRVTATAYTSHGSQTDKTPFLAAWNNRIHPGMKVIAVSRDLLTRYGLRNGSKVKIAGLSGFYRVRDKMNKRFRKRVDIYMGLNRRRALRWGRRSVIIYW
ncbi:Membrane-bound lytic murein transglycosylase D precursor [hydrothermal vent metagenome]|uniref:Membrane-bound lytic murein transglycosylase D n=1 Tax=hydrothermal vent metagenome TaxID=652676 RepID=A0A1W1CEX5_9ZZZZ